MPKAPTVYDVASHAGVSIATVSRVLSRPEAVREATRLRVLEAVRELGYVPSASARGLAGRRTGVLGLLLPGHDALADGEDTRTLSFTDRVAVVDDTAAADRPAPKNGDLYFDELLRGAEVAAWQRGYALMVAAGRGPSRDVIVRDIAGRVDGLAVLASTVPDDLLAQVSRHVPVVMIADSHPDATLDRVGVANEAGMRALTEHVLEARPAGHLVYVTGPADSPDDAGRRAGFTAALAAAAVAPCSVRQIAGDFGRERGRQIALQLIAEAGAGGALPDAVLCSNDQTAIGVLDVLASSGVSVPGRVVVTGFDGIDAGRFTTPRLTTVHQPMGELGRAAVEAVLQRIEDPLAPPRRRDLPVEVLLRESCPPL